MTIYTMGFTQKSAEQFFELILTNKIELLVDIRLNNRSQLAGFTKGVDLAYFLKKICNANYMHCSDLAPTKELLSGYQKGTVSWQEYEDQFDILLERRKISDVFDKVMEKYDRVCLLCSEPGAKFCHRRLVAEKIQSLHKDIEIIHL